MTSATPRRGLLSLVERRPKLTLLMAVLVGLAATAIFQNLPREGRKLALTPVVETVLEDPGSPRAGAADPDVTIVVFTDYQCSVCKATAPALMQLLADDKKVQVIFKDWPILGEASTLAARTALAAHRQGKYLAFHSALMAAPTRLDADHIRRIALSVGIDADQLAANEKTYAAEIDAQLTRHANQAFSLGLRGTPSYLVGPHLIEGGLNEARLAQAVARARASGPPRAPTAP
ncbi:MAG: DsbA family protein [Pseudomonadota bacterium]